MKKTLGALLLTLGLAALPLHAADAAAPTDSVRGPACGDILVDANYSTFGGQAPPTAAATVNTTKPSCEGVTYRMVVLSPAGAVLGTDEEIGDGSSSQFQLSNEPAGGPQFVCISIQSLSTNGRIIDQAPNSPDLECETGAHFDVAGATGGRPMG